MLPQNYQQKQSTSLRRHGCPLPSPHDYPTHFLPFSRRLAHPPSAARRLTTYLCLRKSKRRTDPWKNERVEVDFRTPSKQKTKAFVYHKQSLPYLLGRTSPRRRLRETEKYICRGRDLSRRMEPIIRAQRENKSLARKRIYTTNQVLKVAIVPNLKAGKTFRKRAVCEAGHPLGPYNTKAPPSPAALPTPTCNKRHTRR